MPLHYIFFFLEYTVTLVANFAIPASLGRTAQYAWFFIAYTMLNAVFFTANNIAYASLVTFCTRNSKEKDNSNHKKKTQSELRWVHSVLFLRFLQV